MLGRALGLILLLCSYTSFANEAKVELFSPQGEVKAVRQVTARFATPMVPFGAPTQTEPFTIDCVMTGAARWIDDRNWAFDFDRDLPAGTRCAFALKPDLKDLAGVALSTQSFTFDTGGPAIIDPLPYEGDERIDEAQVFVLGLDALVNEGTVERNAFCDIGGRGERVPVRIVKGAEKKTILDRRHDFLNRIRGRVAPGSEEEKALKARDYDKLPVVLLACKARLPNEAEMRIVWGKGITALTGVETTQDQSLAYKVRPPFLAKFSCDRARANAPCIATLPMRLEFTAPVSVSIAERVSLSGGKGEKFAPILNDSDRKSGFVQYLLFNAPFPERSELKLTLPDGMVDDAGRTLTNAKRYPLQIRIGEAPPLAKFPATFGILESKSAPPALPLTVRNVESVLRGKRVVLPSDPGANTPLPGHVLKVQSPQDIVAWLRRIESAQARYTESGYVSRSVFESTAGVQSITVPRATKSRTAEVIGIPLPKPGFYVVEVVSPKLGAHLLKDARPYYISTGALVTDLAVHFKWGRESSLIWVTSLNKGEPVARAEVQIMDCKGASLFKGATDRDGIARVKAPLPERESLPSCKDKWHRELFVTARLRDDVSFVFSDWGEGITPWRFNLRTAAETESTSAATVLDRSLLRVGEVIGMKHFVRQRAGAGMKLAPAKQLPARMVIRHQGSGEQWELPLKWDAGAGVSDSSWIVPKDAKLGIYEVYLAKPKKSGDNADIIDGQRSGEFRVEAFRVPLLKAQLSVPVKPQVAVSEIDVGVQLGYLSGGGAANQKVRVRPVLQPKPVSFTAHESVAFANGNVIEGPERRDIDRWFDVEDGAADSVEVMEALASQVRPLRNQVLQLDGAGSGVVRIDGLPKADRPQELQTEVEYSDPNGEIATRSARVALWPSNVVLGVKPDGWALAKDKVKLDVIAVDPSGTPLQDVAVSVDAFEREQFSHRKRLIGGFYAYEYGSQINRIGEFCEGRTDATGRLHCEAPIAKSGNVILRARAKDHAGNDAYANAEAWIAGGGEWWFDVSNDDRMDVIAERKRYDPGESARLQVRAPFRDARALVTIEREGVLDAFVTTLSGQEPVVDVPLKGNHAPNIFVSVMAVRGRVTGPAPTALADLGKPAFRMGVAEINVGWREATLAVSVKPERDVYKTREKARVRVEVKGPDGNPMRGGEIALAVVDEGLLDLLPNPSWDLLTNMMRPRAMEVVTSTGSTQVIGKRHFGKKAVPTGGGGGRQVTRELFDTLLLWRARIKLDDNGNAEVEVPLNDSLTAFRIVAVANAGAGLFGTGSTTIRTSQDVILSSGLPPVVRDADQFLATFTVRNGAAQPLELKVAGKVDAALEGGKKAAVPIEAQSVRLEPGEAKDVTWPVTVPGGAESLRWQISAAGESAAGAELRDAVNVTQRVAPVVPVRIVQATLLQVDREAAMSVARPSNAIAGKGGVSVQLRPRLAESLTGVREFMERYPFTCLEQRASQAVALRDNKRWEQTMSALPAHLDADGFAKYFAPELQGGDTLTAYLLTISHAARLEIPEASRTRMVNALTEFVHGRVSRNSALATSDMTIRKIAALESLMRYGVALDPNVLSTMSIEPNLWPTSALIDWLSLTMRWDALPDRAERQQQAEHMLRSRLNMQGTVMGFSNEDRDFLWWLMVSADVNANRALLALMDLPQWREDLPRLARGVMARQNKGAWNTTVANAWGAIAFDAFGQKFEREKVSGATHLALGAQERRYGWPASGNGAEVQLGWAERTEELRIVHEGSGKPWALIQSKAAIPLGAALRSGYNITKQMSRMAEAEMSNGNDVTKHHRGDVVRVTLDVDAQADMTWVVVSDPVPSGATVLGSGLGDGGHATANRARSGTFTLVPVFEERTFEAYRAYYRFIPKGRWTVQYSMRLNNVGTFELPPTRVEAMYAPESFGEAPNVKVSVLP